MAVGDYIDLLKTHGIQISMSRRGKLARSRFASANPVLMGALAIYLWTKR